MKNVLQHKILIGDMVKLATGQHDRCSICKGINPPHPIDEYHAFLLQIQRCQSDLESVQELVKRLPSLKIQFTQAMDSIKRLNKEALDC